MILFILQGRLLSHLSLKLGSCLSIRDLHLLPRYLIDVRLHQHRREFQVLVHLLELLFHLHIPVLVPVLDLLYLGSLYGYLLTYLPILESLVLDPPLCILDLLRKRLFIDPLFARTPRYLMLELLERLTVAIHLLSQQVRRVLLVLDDVRYGFFSLEDLLRLLGVLIVEVGQLLRIGGSLFEEEVLQLLRVFHTLERDMIGLSRFDNFAQFFKALRDGFVTLALSVPRARLVNFIDIFVSNAVATLNDNFLHLQIFSHHLTNQNSCLISQVAVLKVEIAKFGCFTSICRPKGRILFGHGFGDIEAALCQAFDQVLCTLIIDRVVGEV